MRFILILNFLMLCTFASGQTLMIFGGDGHDVYLGKLNSSEYDSDSIWNEYGIYGNSYSSTSIWNEYGTYGSEYSLYSPFNEYATCPPVIVDARGNFYGYFTVNEFKSDRAEFKLALIIYKYHELIRDNVSGWYGEIFD